ncbi:hypothetical protein, partial [Prochlorothrix hollandica]|uniref:hypothetical protein n=1 Tax=Prochlorothrix hollandica TaxID=1223 RepID=UPI00334155BB
SAGVAVVAAGLTAGFSPETTGVGQGLGGPGGNRWFRPRVKHDLGFTPDIARGAGSGLWVHGPGAGLYGMALLWAIAHNQGTGSKSIVLGWAIANINFANINFANINFYSGFGGKGDRNGNPFLILLFDTVDPILCPNWGRSPLLPFPTPVPDSRSHRLYPAITSEL